MMTEWFSFFSETWQTFLGKEAIDQVAIAATFLLPLFITSFGWVSGVRTWRFHKKRLENQVDTLTIKLEKEKSDNDKALKDAAEWNPQTWLTKSEKERRNKNEAIAVHALENGFNKIRDNFSALTYELTQHHMSLIAEDDDDAHLNAAIRLGRMSHLLAPNNKSMAAVSDEFNFLTSGKSIGVFKDELPEADWPRDPKKVTSLINAIISKRRQEYEAGHYFTVEKLDARAEFLAERAGLYNSVPGFLARHYHSESLYLIGQFNLALEKTQKLLPLRQKVQGEEHPSVLSTRSLEAQLLNDTGQSKLALEKIQTLLPLYQKVQEEEHPSVQSTRYLETQLLNGTGQSKLALEKIQKLLPLYQKVQGEEHPSVLATRNLEAKLLNETGQSKLALEKIQTLLPLYQKVQGEEHPHVLSTRYLEAQLLNHTGQSKLALEKIQTLLPLEQKVQGEEHPSFLRSRWLNAKITSMLGDDAKALLELEDILPIQIKEQTTEHQFVKETEALISDIKGRFAS